MACTGTAAEGGTDQVLVQEHGSTRILILNRPKQLNALTAEMFMQLHRLFISYEGDAKVKLLIIKGAGRAFCAGGDLSQFVHSATEVSWTGGADFLWNAYMFYYTLATYSKPQVSILKGIVMGAGCGVSIHGKFRVATENSVFAMPETELGFFPDIAASFFLPRLSGFFGEYVGLTGARLDGAEMLACGLATHFVPSSRLHMLEEALKMMDTTDPFAISAVIDQFSVLVPLKCNSAYKRLDIINKCFSKRTIQEILYALEEESKINSDDFITSAIQSLMKASPVSLKISLRAIREGRSQGLDQCFLRDYRMACHVVRRDVSSDFFEGYRAIVVDKDRKPKWEPSRLDLVSDEMVDQYFTKVDDPNWIDLKLPSRHGFSIETASKL